MTKPFTPTERAFLLKLYERLQSPEARARIEELLQHHEDPPPGGRSDSGESNPEREPSG